MTKYALLFCLFICSTASAQNPSMRWLTGNIACLSKSCKVSIFINSSTRSFLLKDKESLYGVVCEKEMAWTIGADRNTPAKLKKINSQQKDKINMIKSWVFLASDPNSAASVTDILVKRNAQQIDLLSNKQFTIVYGYPSKFHIGRARPVQAKIADNNKNIFLLTQAPLEVYTDLSKELTAMPRSCKTNTAILSAQ